MPPSNYILSSNNVTITGTGEQVLLLAHGFGCNQQMWRFLLPLLSPNFRIVLFDYVGSGASDMQAYNKQRYASLDGYALDIIEICEALNLEKCHPMWPFSQQHYRLIGNAENPAADPRTNHDLPLPLFPEFTAGLPRRFRQSRPAGN